MAEINKQEKTVLGFEERRRISFHIAGVHGLPHPGWQPLASTYVQLEVLETRQSFSTENRKASPSILWEENLPIMDLKDSNKVRFEIRSHMLWNKAVLGRTEPFSIQELFRMQREVGEEREAYIDLVVTPTLPVFTLPKSPTSVGHRRSMSTPVNPKGPLSPTRLRKSLSPTRKTYGLPSPDAIILTLRIRETAAKNRNNTLTAADYQRFVQKCQVEALVELRDSVEKLFELRNTFQSDGSSLTTLLDIVLGTAEGVRKAIASPSTRNINQNTVACIRALNEALVPYRDLSRRRLEKLGESSAVFMNEMLCGAVRALESITVFLGMDNAYIRDKYEFKVTRWLRYFEECRRYLVGSSPDRPQAVVFKLRRVRCPIFMIQNSELPQHNLLDMALPKVRGNDVCIRPTVLSVSEWIFSSPPTHPLHSPAVHSPNNLMCLSCPSGSRLTGLAAHLSLWFSELGCLGGYFTFDHNKSLSPSATLEALPLTLVHQAATVEPDMIVHVKNAFFKDSDIVSWPLEARFRSLFTEPLRSYMESRLPTGGAWNPLPPMVFIIDGFGAAQSTDAGVIDAFADWIVGKGVSSLPPHVKFLLLAGPEGGLDVALKTRQAACMYATMELENPSTSRVDGFFSIAAEPEIEKSLAPTRPSTFQVQVQ